MNERKTTDDAVKDDERLEREMPRENEAGSAPTPISGDGKMSTAELAYGRDQGSKTKDDSGRRSTGGEIVLIEEKDAGGFRERWTTIQTSFIDEPRDTVGEADELVAEVIQSLARRFAEERHNLEQQWQSGSEVSTEDLRLAMQHYRSFFERLLAA
jgi:hypothetical protein